MAAALADDHASPGKENRIAVTVRADVPGHPMPEMVKLLPEPAELAA